MEEHRDGEIDEVVEDGTFDMEDIEEAEESGRPRLDADFLLDKVIPDSIDWRDLVRRHPLISVGVAAAAGFILGRAKGAAIISGVSAGLSGAVMRQLSDVFEGEVFEF